MSLQLSLGLPDSPAPVRRVEELQVVKLALELGAAECGGTLSEAEACAAGAASACPPCSMAEVESARRALRTGADPLGDMLCATRSGLERRKLGAFYTPGSIVRPMVNWVLERCPDRIVDAGCGSGRFAIAATLRGCTARIVAVDVDPVATLITRAALAVVGARNATVLQTDYTALRLDPIRGRTAFLGNPPYVRHHDLPAALKAHGAALAAAAGVCFSGLAGLHAYFFLATAALAAPGDIGCFVTSSEWLDVAYGASVRELLCDGLGAAALHVVSPRSVPFADAMTTAAITCFEVGRAGSTVTVGAVDDPLEITDLSLGATIPISDMARARRWSPFLRSVADAGVSRQVPLGTIVRVHRGVVTGANAFFVMSAAEANKHGLMEWCRPAITSGQEIIKSDGAVRHSFDTRLLLDLPRNVARTPGSPLDQYLRSGEQPDGSGRTVASGYIASRRTPWWHLGRVGAPPIVVSYMARQAPVFALNPDGMAILNIAHGLYPRRPMTAGQMRALVDYLNGARQQFVGHGRTYYGGLEKFEPGELERLPVPADGPWCE